MIVVKVTLPAETSVEDFEKYVKAQFSDARLDVERVEEQKKPKTPAEEHAERENEHVKVVDAAFGKHAASTMFP